MLDKIFGIQVTFPDKTRNAAKFLELVCSTVNSATK